MRRLTNIVRTRAAIFLAVAYAFCVMAPSVSVAFAHSASAFHCLTEIKAADTAVHAHGESQAGHDGAAHEHGDPGHASGTTDHTHSDKSSGGESCCGLFCVSALAQDVQVSLAHGASASSAVQAPAGDLIGHGPGQLHRPPIA